MAGFLKRLLGSENAQAVAILTVLLVAFLWTPISRYDECYLSSADLLQDFSLIKVDPKHVAGNALLSDAVTEMKPWRMFNRDEFAAGRFPLWNPFNGTGCPHFANYQSAVVSPFSLPYYLFDVKTALIAVSFLKLFALGILTYLYLKQIRIGHAAALTGATAFMFSGHNVLLLTFPHVGALVTLPGGFLFVERAIQKHVQGRHYGGELIGLGLVILAGALAGNPEPFYFAMLLTGAYSLARLVGTWLEARREPQALRRLLPLALSLLIAPVLAAGMTTFQTLPFLEYLRNSHVFEERSQVQTPLDPRFWPLEMFPNILGNPASPYILDYSIPPPNFELVNTAHISGLVSFLAAIALLFVWSNRYARFFWIAGALWACYAYDLFGVSHVFQLLPTLAMAPMNRSQGLWLFCLACLAALAIDGLVKRNQRSSWLGAQALLLAGCAFLLAHLVGADRLIEEFSRVPSPNHEKFLDYVPDRILVVVRYFGLGAGLAALLLLLRSQRWRGLAALGFLPLVFLPTGWHWRNYEPVCEDRFFYPETPMLADLKASVGEERVAILSEDSLPPMANLAWRLNIVPNYDGMWVRDFDALHRVLFGDTYNWRPLVKGSERALQLTAVPWVLAKWSWLFFDSGLGEMPRGRDVRCVRQEILPGKDVRQGFTCHQSNLQAVMVYLSAYPRAENRDLAFRLEEADTGRVLNEQAISVDEIRSTIYAREQRRFPGERHVNPLGREVVFHFPPIADSQGKRYRFVLSAKGGTPGDCVYAWSFSARAYGEGTAFSGKEELAGELWFDFSYNQDRFELVKQIGEYGLYRYKGALPMFHAVGGAVYAKDDAECLSLLRTPLFDPRNMVVINEDEHAPPASEPVTGQRRRDVGRLIKVKGSVKVYCVLNDGQSIVWVEDEATFLANKFRWEDVETVPREEFERFTIVKADPALTNHKGLRMVSPAEEGGSTPQILEASPTRYRMKLTRQNPGYLVISQARYPGWKARINGAEVPVLRANYAFNAIALARGEMEIEFSYEPLSFRLGLAISAASALIGLLLVWKLAHTRLRALRG